MTKSVLLRLSLILTIGSAAVAQTAPTLQEKIACRSDAMKLCSTHVGKTEEMNSCLHDNKANLSDPCRKVVEAHGG